MTHAFLTVAMPFPADRADAADDVLATMGNPPSGDLLGKLDAVGTIHFMSAIVVRNTGPGRCHLLMEASADGTVEQAAASVAGMLDAECRALLAAAGLPLGGGSLASLLLRHNLRLGYGWRLTTGLPFTGVPGMSVRRIRGEAALAAQIGGMRDVLEAAAPPMAKLHEVRERLWAERGRWKWAFAAEPTPFLTKGGMSTTWRQAFAALVAPIRLAAPLLVVPLLLSPLLGLLVALLASAVVLAALAGGAVFWLRRLERSDAPGNSPPNAARLAEILEQENRTEQNLLATVSVMKPGLFRRLALRLALGVVNESSARTARPGFLADIGVIHFARWVLLPGTDRLVFLSNFSHSWESYLEDFITQAAKGLTSIWSNVQDFPRTRLLFNDGATDGARFRRWARHQQVRVRFWYSAYPELPMGRIRTNAAIRQGIAAARTEADAADWLSCFGGSPCPASSLDTPDVPTLAFGGLSTLPHVHCLVYSLPPVPAAGQLWLRGIAPDVAFGETDPCCDQAITLGLSIDGLRRLGLAEDDLATFPVAFQHGMAAAARAPVLGDTGNDAAKHWAWGQAGTADIFLAIYHRDAEALDGLVARIEDQARSRGLVRRHGHRLASLPARAPGVRRSLTFDAFGFVDGISQPILRSMPKARRYVSADHVIEAGELLLGYPDNSGHLPLTPSVAAGRDPERLLPALAPDPTGVRPSFLGGGSEGRRDLGRNGTFLVVRQLDQYPAKLERYVADQAKRLLAHVHPPWPLPAGQLAALLKAKMVGRWQDGRSLVRHPQSVPAVDGAPDNDFRFGQEDPQGLQCPFGAHVRRANPRDTFDSASAEPLRISNRHRILRVGRPYGADSHGDAGLMFMCLNADIERQFEFVQRSWLLGRNFHNALDEVDPLVGNKPHAGCFTIPTRQGPVELKNLPDFVRLRGGGYFFMPGRQALRYLALTQQ